MTLATKPHCKKHHIYTQGCIGCRIKAKQPKPLKGNGEPYTDEELAMFEPLPFPDHTTELKTLLNRIYTDGAIGNTRSLDKDVQTIRELK